MPLRIRPAFALNPTFSTHRTSPGGGGASAGDGRIHGRAVFVGDQNYTVDEDDRSIVLESTDGLAHTIDFTGVIGRVDGQLVDVSMTTNAIAPGNFGLLGVNDPQSFSLVGDHALVQWSLAANQWVVLESSTHRSSSLVVALLFDVSTAGSFDGATSFVLPDPLPARNSSGQHVIPVTSAAGLIDPDSIEALVGPGYWIRSAALNNQNASVIQVLVGLTQPKPSLAGNAITTAIFQQFGNPEVNGQRPIRRGPFVPPGFIIQLFCADGGGTPVVGPYELALELETLPRIEDTARAIRSQEFPPLPTATV